VTTILMLAMAVIAALLTSALFGIDTPPGAIELGLPMVVVITAAAELAAVERRFGSHGHTLSLSEVGLVVTVACAAPAVVVAGRVVAGLVVLGAKRVPLRRVAFNVSLFALEAAVAAAVFHGISAGSPAHEPEGWIALTGAMVAATVIGLSGVRAVLAVNGVARDHSTIALSLAVTVMATTLGIMGVVALNQHTEASVLVVVGAVVAYAAMRAISTLLDRLVAAS
jgi:hypothetical protein